MSYSCKYKIVYIALIMAFLVSSMPVGSVFAEENVSGITDSTTGTENNAIYGDLNDDGRVDSGDFTTLRSLLLKKVTMKPEWKVIADLNDDGRVDSADYVILRRYLLKQISVLPYKPQITSTSTPTPTVTTITPTPVRDYIYSAVGSKFIIKQSQVGPIPEDSPDLNKWTYTISHDDIVKFVETYTETIPNLYDIWNKVWVFESLSPGKERIEFTNYNGTQKKDYFIFTYEKQLITPTPVNIDTTEGETFSISHKIPLSDAEIWELSYDSTYIELVNEKNMYLDCTGWDIERHWELKALKEGNCVIICKSKELSEVHTYNVNIKGS